MIQFNEIRGDLFDAPDDTLLIHACNCMGVWGAGIAKAFKDNYPQAFEVYRKHCSKNDMTKIIGTCLLIPPCEDDVAAPRHWIACLYSSQRYGRNKDTAECILGYTASAMYDLLNKIGDTEDGILGELRMCKINSGSFEVPWEDTKIVLGDLPGEERKREHVVITVYDRN